MPLLRGRTTVFCPPGAAASRLIPPECDSVWTWSGKTLSPGAHGMYNNLTGDKGDNKSEETRETGQVKKFINCLNFWVITMQTKIRNAVLEPKGEM